MKNFVPDYDKTSPISIYEFALKLTGKSLSEAISVPANVENARNRGDLGALVEKYYFQHVPPNNHEPDFAEAGLELKTTGLIRDSKGKFKAKERLVLSMINFQEIVNESWESSRLRHKCNLMLILFYQYDKRLTSFQRKFVIDPILMSFISLPPKSYVDKIDGACVLSPEDMAVIRSDWEVIQGKVKEGRAHELSEGDTFYLGACRKGSGRPSEALVRQPFSEIGAKSRAFSLKQSYLNKIINLHTSKVSILGISSSININEATQLKFKPYNFMAVDEIANIVKLQKTAKFHKAFLRDLARKILSADGIEPLELQKAGIEIKTIRLKRNGKPREAMSFPAFHYLDIINEQWESSSFYEKLESKFLFIIFQEDADGVERLIAARYWNMPYEDREQARTVWEETKRRVKIDASNLPKSSDNPVAHVRPKGRNGSDKEITPQGDMQMKKCFWLNLKYIEKVVADLIL